MLPVRCGRRQRGLDFFLLAWHGISNIWQNWDIIILSSANYWQRQKKCLPVLWETTVLKTRLKGIKNFKAQMSLFIKRLKWKTKLEITLMLFISKFKSSLILGKYPLWIQLFSLKKLDIFSFFSVFFSSSSCFCSF